MAAIAAGVAIAAGESGCATFRIHTAPCVWVLLKKEDNITPVIDLPFLTPLSAEEEAKRIYRTLGKRTLDPTEDWTDVTDETDLDAAGWRFFKVKVEMR